MIDFVKALQKESESKIFQIEADDSSTLQKSLNAFRALDDVFEKMKEFILAYKFTSEQEEISFFKDYKPKIFSRSIYYRKIYNIEMGKAISSIEAQKDYLHKKLDAIQEFYDKIVDFYRYYRSGSTHLDSVYFLRGKPGTKQYLDTFYYERDSQFSTYGDFNLSRILANEMLQAYLINKLKTLSDDHLQQSDSSLPKVKETWTDNKTDLTELLYAIDTVGSIGNGKVPLKHLVHYFESVLNIDLGNVHRNFYDMRIRNNPTPFLDRLKTELTKRMESTDWKKGVVVERARK